MVLSQGLQINPPWSCGENILYSEMIFVKLKDELFNTVYFIKRLMVHLDSVVPNLFTSNSFIHEDCCYGVVKVRHR